MIRKSVFCVVAFAFFLMLPGIAVAQGSAPPAAAVSPTAFQISDADRDFVLEKIRQTPEDEEVPGTAEDPVFKACPWTYIQCSTCGSLKIRRCEYWGCSGTLVGCGPCLPACAF
jgi:hypothetical protein